MTKRTHPAQIEHCLNVIVCVCKYYQAIIHVKFIVIFVCLFLENKSYGDKPFAFILWCYVTVRHCRVWHNTTVCSRRHVVHKATSKLFRWVVTNYNKLLPPFRKYIRISSQHLWALRKGCRNTWGRTTLPVTTGWVACSQPNHKQEYRLAGNSWLHLSDICVRASWKRIAQAGNFSLNLNFNIINLAIKNKRHSSSHAVVPC